jgi:hypothetical protein
MRHLFVLFLFVFTTLAKAQKFEFPKLAAQGSTLSSLIPQNWKAIDTVYGDLNHDAQNDMALILEFIQPVTELRAYGDADTEIIKEFQKPRILAIYFKQKKKFAIALQNNNFILRANEGGTYGDPYDGLTIDSNTLQLTFRGGSNWRWKLDYQFRYTQHNWILINATNLYFHDASGEMEEKSYNFITREVKETRGNLKSINSNTISRNILLFNDLRTFSTFKKPWTWEVRKDEFL